MRCTYRERLWHEGAEAHLRMRVFATRRNFHSSISIRAAQISLNTPDQQSEWIFAVDDEDDRDEWINCIKMIMLQELDPKTKKQSQAEERAKAKGKAAPRNDVVGTKKSVLAGDPPAHRAIIALANERKWRARPYGRRRAASRAERKQRAAGAGGGTAEGD